MRRLEKFAGTLLSAVVMSAGLAVVSATPALGIGGGIDVFARGAGGHLAGSSGRIDVFAPGGNGHLVQVTYGPGWSTNDRGGSLALA